MHIVYPVPSGPGWHPVTHMVRLAAELLEAHLHCVPSGRASVLTRLTGFLPRHRSSEPCLIVCGGPTQLLSLLDVEGWRRRFGWLGAWIIDSYWLENIPMLARAGRHFDRYFVTEEEDVEAWQELTRAPATWLPWGSDVLRLGSGSAERPLDLLRLGRQPDAWDRDEETERACRALGLRFHGRPGFREDATDNEREVMSTIGRSKFTLSFTPAVSPGPQTHPTREYVTARWTDALGAGATVAGVAPRCATARKLLWPGALLDTGTVDLADGLRAVAGAVLSWTPRAAALNHLRSLERLDWRWRLEALTSVAGLPVPARLRADLAQLRRAVEDHPLRSAPTGSSRP